MKFSLLRSVLPHLALLITLLATSNAQAELDFHPGKRVRLANGRYIHYAEYGVPTGNLVLYFHGTPGSHLEVGLCDEELDESGIRLISINRPGIGNSTYYGCRRITDWPTDVDQLLAAMGIEGAPFGIIALSGGAPYGLAVARAMPERVTHLALVSGHTPPGAPVVRGNSDDMIDLLRRRPRLGNFGIGLLDRRLNRKPDSIVKQVTKSWTAADRKLVLCNPKLKNRLVANLREATVCGPQGLVKDIGLLGSCWGFAVAEAAGVDVSIWQGGCDRIVTPSMAHYFHSQLPGSTLTIDPKAGHVTMFKWHVHEILKNF
ncbi:alpha/beta fold hydrolase [Adhaeretor mobilis]|uniref:Alpha/beta hydrolase family protein n=1 Tax=Adhaeretor mobilis TaxID=1930276 RepID=A0A517MYR7_9BACT|nr:alpha/beta hydrolase [Adhaeretor mobilis]QDT00010.1 Alpha/beta hydrolase family protein [Adhaeretor mobilis]